MTVIRLSDIPDSPEDDRIIQAMLLRFPPMTWEEVITVQPGLLALQRDAQAVRGDAGKYFCANEVWYERFKPRLLRLVGWTADTDTPVVRSSAAYDAAYEYLYDQLPNCRNCGCPYPMDFTS